MGDSNINLPETMAKKELTDRKAKKVSQVIFASCTASKGTFFRPEWGQFPRPQVEHPPPRSAKLLKEPALAPGDFDSSPRGPSFFEDPRLTG